MANIITMLKKILMGGVLSMIVGLFGITPALAVGDSTSYPQDTSLALSGVPVALTILAGSASNTLSVGTTSFTPTVNVGTFTVRYSGPSPKKFTDGTTTYCNYVGGNNDYAFTSAHNGKTISISAETCGTTSGGGGGSSYVAPSAAMSIPNGGESWTAGQVRDVFWSASGSTVLSVRLSFSTDGGANFATVIAASEANDGHYVWTVPQVATTRGRLKIEALGGGATLASDVSDADFTVITPDGSTVTPDATTPTTPETPPVLVTPIDEPLPSSVDPTPYELLAPAQDDNVIGGYSSIAAAKNTPTINVDKELKPLPPEKPAPCAPGKLIRGSQPAVYYCGKDGKRYVFTSERAYLTWYRDFSGVQRITNDVLAGIPLGGNITYRPGVRMVKIQTDPKVYAIARGGILRWVQSENVARILYGLNWNKKIDDVSDAFFINYRMGAPITETEIDDIPAS